MNIKKHFALLGLKARDAVTGFPRRLPTHETPSHSMPNHGVITSISFDLYGCVQVVIQPTVDEKGGSQDGQWFDVSRVEVLSSDPVMPVPDFFQGDSDVSKGEKGPAEKPLP